MSGLSSNRLLLASGIGLLCATIGSSFHLLVGPLQASSATQLSMYPTTYPPGHPTPVLLLFPLILLSSLSFFLLSLLLSAHPPASGVGLLLLRRVHHAPHNWHAHIVRSFLETGFWIAVIGFTYLQTGRWLLALNLGTICGVGVVLLGDFCTRCLGWVWDWEVRLGYKFNENEAALATGTAPTPSPASDLSSNLAASMSRVSALEGANVSEEEDASPSAHAKSNSSASPSNNARILKPSLSKLDETDDHLNTQGPNQQTTFASFGAFTLFYFFSFLGYKTLYYIFRFSGDSSVSDIFASSCASDQTSHEFSNSAIDTPRTFNASQHSHITNFDVNYLQLSPYTNLLLLHLLLATLAGLFFIGTANLCLLASPTSQIGKILLTRVTHARDNWRRYPKRSMGEVCGWLMGIIGSFHFSYCGGEITSSIALHETGMNGENSCSNALWASVHAMQFGTMIGCIVVFGGHCWFSPVDNSQVDDSQVDGSQVDNSQVNNSQVDNSQVDNSQVDNSQVDNSQVDNSQVDNSQVDNSQVDNSLSKVIKGPTEDAHLSPEESVLKKDANSSGLSTSPISSSPCPVREKARQEGLVLIDGNWYSVGKFVPHHPGGEEILRRYLGTDISFVFRSMHRNPMQILKRRKPLRPATPEELNVLSSRRHAINHELFTDYFNSLKNKANCETTDLSIDSPDSETSLLELKKNFDSVAFEKDIKELYDQFRDDGYFNPTLPWLIRHTSILLSLLIFSVIFMHALPIILPTIQSFLPSSSLISTLLHSANYTFPGVCLGLFWHQSGYMMHDAEHHNLYGNELANDVMGWFFGTICLGVNGAWWREEHREHHAMLNTYDESGFMDPQMVEDVWIQHKRLMPFFGDQLVHGLANFQHVLFLPIIALLGRLGIVIDSTLTERKFRPWTKLGNIFHILLHYLVLTQTNYPLQVYVVGALWQSILALQLLGNHITKSWNPIDVATDGSFFLWQVLTTQDFACPVWMRWCYGGLNFHYSHHLFPTMSREYFHLSTPRIRALCAKHGIPVVEISFPNCVKEMLNNFREVRKEFVQYGRGNIGLAYF